MWHETADLRTPEGNICFLTSNGALLKLVELAFDETQHQTGLAHRRLPQQHQFELADLIRYGGPVGPGRSSAASGHRGESEAADGGGGWGGVTVTKHPQVEGAAQSQEDRPGHTGTDGGAVSQGREPPSGKSRAT